MSYVLIPTMKVISGGQTGADQGALEAAVELGLLTGGTAPKGYLTEDGPNLTLRDAYGLTEHKSPSYAPRTRANVANSDGTVLYGKTTSPGCAMTIEFCEELNKPYIKNPTQTDLREWLQIHRIHTLNVAGNRESKNPGIQAGVKALLLSALGGHS